jgi:hypothetical protein
VLSCGDEPCTLCLGLLVLERGLLEIVRDVSGGVLLLVGLGGSVTVDGLLGGLAGGVGGTVGGTLVLLRLQLLDLLLRLGDILQAC